jgi:hypothetical protein
MKRNAYATLFLALLLSGPCAWAQVVATMTGVVRDQSNAVVPDATVTLVNEGSGFTRSAQTNPSGQYVASSIPTGSYTLTVEKPGFERLVRTGVQLTAATTLEVDLQLHVGSEQQSVSVSAAAPLLQTQTAAVSYLVNNTQMVGLPLVNRDFTDLILLTPGAHLGTSSNYEVGVGQSVRSDANFSVNGAQPASNSYLIDGIFNRNMWLNTLVMVPIVDAIQEYRVMTNNYSGEYGESAGAVTVVETKSGTNQFHGDAWEFVRNTAFNANEFFDNANGIPEAPFHQNEFGGTFGGPLKHDKTFLFADYQGLRIDEPITQTATIPTEAERLMVETGNFSGLGQTIYNPYSLYTLPNGTQARAPFPSNTIPTSMLSPPAVKLISLLPTPTTAGAVDNFTSNPPATQRTDQFDVRLDQNLSSSDRLFVKYSYDNTDQVSPGAIPSPANSGLPLGPYLSAGVSDSALQSTTPLLNQSLTLGYTKTLSPTEVNEMHFGVVRFNYAETPLDSQFATATALGIPGINISNVWGGMPTFTISGFTSLGNNDSLPAYQRTTTFQLDDTLTKVKGSHTLEAGGLFLRDRFDGFSAIPARGSFCFNGQFTRQVGASGSGTVLADFALGVPDSVSRGILENEFGVRGWELAPFFQDSWRIMNRLTLNMGLRWDLDFPPYEVHNEWTNLDLATGLLKFAGIDGNGRTLRNLDADCLAPRAGLAYALTSDRKTVLRSGFGISYVDEGAGGDMMYTNPPFSFSQAITTNINGIPPVTLSNGLPTPVPALPTLANETALATGNVDPWDLNLQEVEALQWSFGIQREISPNLMLSVSYVGTRGLGLTPQYDYNQSAPGPGAQAPRYPMYSINPNLVDVNYVTNIGDSTYNGLQVQLEKRYSFGLMFNLSYTYASYLSDVGDINGGGVSDQNDACIRCSWGPDPDDYTHVLVFNHAYELPFGPGRHFLNHGVGSYLLGNWNVNGIWSVESGQHFTPTLGTNVSNSSGGGSQRPNRIGSGRLPSSQQSINDWFNFNDFVAPPEYEFGNSGTGILTGPGYFDFDMAIIRHFRLSERFGLDYRLEAFNTFNRANFNVPDATIGTASAGVISGTSAARIVQMALKLTF